LRSEIGASCIKPRKFQKQIEFLLNRGYEFTTLSNLVANKNKPNLIALTFDDGYQDIYLYAYPILKNLGIPATLFLIAKYLDRPNTWDINLGRIRFNHLTHNNIAELIQNGWEIGSHGLSHRLLVGMPTAEMQAEIHDSKKLLEEQFKSEVRFFCAPFGKLNRKIISEAESAGYQGICGFFPFKYYNHTPPDFIITRLAVYSFDTLNAVSGKLATNWPLRLEIIKQNVVNFCANGTIIVQKLR